MNDKDRMLKFKILYYLSNDYFSYLRDESNRIEKDFIEAIENYAREHKIESKLPYAYKEVIDNILSIEKKRHEPLECHLHDALDLCVLSNKFGSGTAYTKEEVERKIERIRQKKRE